MGKYEQEILSSTRNNQVSPTDIPVTRSTREKRKREIDREIPRLHDPPRPHCRRNSSGRVPYK